ncbi:MAG: DUF45 domain-containing protein [Lachnospiraceae bacterium]|nr:DUF45 domain-containing protein [Lachnospiraceae bacterium]
MENEFETLIVRSKRRTIGIRIETGHSIKVSAPKSVSDRDIYRLLEEKKNWILKHLEMKRKEEERAKDVSPLTEAEIKELRKRAKEILTQKTEAYAKIIGVTYGKISVRIQETRWGSCSSKGNLNYNLLLMLTPTEVQDYVVVHELCHRKQMNHSVRFWKEVENILPDYKVRRKWLKDNGAAIFLRLDKKETVENKTYYTYILACSDGTYYTGYTPDLKGRLLAHNSGTGAKYTKTRLPVKLVYHEEFKTKREAMSREVYIKQLTRKEKEKLIGNYTKNK